MSNFARFLKEKKQSFSLCVAMSAICLLHSKREALHDDGTGFFKIPICSAATDAWMMN